MASLDAARPGERLTREHLLLFALCAVGYLMDGLSSAILGPLAPAISANLHLSKAELGSVFSASLLGQSLGLIVIPLFQGRLGPRRTIVWSTVLFGLGGLASGLAASRNQLFLCRLIIGVGVGGALPAGIALVAELAPASRRGTAVMSLILAFTIGLACAGLVGGLLAGGGNMGWRWALAATGAASLLAAVVQGRLLPDSPAFVMRGRPEPTQPVRTASEDSPWRLFSPDLLSGTLLLWFMLINGTIVAYCLTSWLPTLLVNSGRSARLGAVALTAFSIGGVLSTLIVGLLIERVGAFLTLGASFSACALFLILSAVSIHSAPDGLLLALLAAVGVFLFGAFGGLDVLIADHYPTLLRAVGAGWAKSAGRIGSVLGPVLVGWALSRGVREQNVLLFFALPALLVALAITGMFFTSRRRTALPTYERAAG